MAAVGRFSAGLDKHGGNRPTATAVDAAAAVHVHWLSDLMGTPIMGLMRVCNQSQLEDAR